MCLGLPGKLVHVEGEAGVMELHGRRVEVNLAFVPGARVGSWLLAHSGVAVRVIPEADAVATWDLLDEAALR